MKFTVGRLERTNGRKRIKMLINFRVNDAFKDFGNEIEIRNRAVAGKIIGRKVVLFKTWANNCSFERMRKKPF